MSRVVRVAPVLRTARFGLAALAVVSVLAVTAASANAEICPNAVALRVNDSGLRFIAQQAKPLVPKSVALPAISSSVVGVSVQVAPLTASIELSTLELSIKNSALRLSGRADVTTGGAVSVGSSQCTANVQLRSLSLDAGLKVDTLGGRVRVTVTDLRVDIDNKTSVIALEGCTLGSILTAVLDFVRGHFMGTIQSAIEGIAKDKIPALVADKLDDTLEYSHTFKGFTFTGRLDSLQTDSGGISATLGVGVETSGPAAPCAASAGPAESCIGASPQLPSGGSAMFGLGVSSALLDRGLHRVHQSGMLCIDSETLTLPAVQQQLDGLGPVLGLPADTKLGFSVRLAKAPRVRMSPQHGVELLVDGLQVELRVQPAGGKLERALLATDIVVAATPWIDPNTNSVALDLHHLALDHFALEGAGPLSPAPGGGSPLALDPERLSRFIGDVIVPLLRARLSQAQLSPSLMNVSDYVVELATVQIGSGYLSAQINAFVPKAVGDRQAPDTVLRQGPSDRGVVGPQVLHLQVEGKDNLTPTALMRYKLRVDGGPWSEPSYGGRFELAIESVAAQVEVAAIDEDGNVDETPLSLHLRVDAEAPQLTITARPDPLVDGGRASVAFAVRDNRTPAGGLTLTAKLLRVPDGGGVPQVIEQRVIPAGATTVSFDRLEGGVYKIRVVVADEVGNVTSEDVGFVVEQGGCSALPGAGGAGLPLACMVLLMLALVRRSMGD
jgi:hypothetical protein